MYVRLCNESMWVCMRCVCVCVHNQADTQRVFNSARNKNEEKREKLSHFLVLMYVNYRGIFHAEDLHFNLCTEKFAYFQNKTRNNNNNKAINTKAGQSRREKTNWKRPKKKENYNKIKENSLKWELAGAQSSVCLSVYVCVSLCICTKGHFIIWFASAAASRAAKEIAWMIFIQRWSTANRSKTEIAQVRANYHNKTLFFMP